MKLTVEQLTELTDKVRERIVPEAREYIAILQPLLSPEGLTHAGELGRANARLVNAAICAAIEELP